MTERNGYKNYERRMKSNRSDLGDMLADLTGRLGPGLVADQVSDFVRENAAPYAKRAEKTVRDNPLAFALAGAGIAWLLISRKSGEDDHVTTATLTERYEDVEEDWSEEIDRLRAKASVRLRALEDDAQDSVDSGRNFAQERADMIAQYASDIRAKLSKDLDGVSEEAKKLVLDARERAYAAKLKAQSHASKAADETTQFVKDHPVVVAALGVAIGAAIVAALPKDRLRSSSIGGHVDRIKKEASALYTEEKKRAETLARKFKKDATDVVRDVAHTAETEGSDLSDRIARELSSEADKSALNFQRHIRGRNHRY
ncbi:hypothetical protein ERN12_15260 [Rhodobacteraceae bacterium]|nr:hypothetical protein ERN12_15260 [Paracoccaceae bacterium]